MKGSNAAASTRRGTASTGAAAAAATLTATANNNNTTNNIDIAAPDVAPTNQQQQRPAKRGQSAVEGKSDDARDQKRRRRAFSCLSCQKLKCRCEYESGSPGCHRCQTLRIGCSLGVDHGAPTSPHSASPKPGLNIEERLQRHEEALKEIQAMIAELKSQRQPPDARSHTETEPHQLAGGNRLEVDEQASGPAYLSRPADSGTKSAPIVVLREINAHVYKGYGRRLLQHTNLDFSQLGLVDEDVAKDLIELFVHYQGHNLIVCNVDELPRVGVQRKVSAFIHNVCCLLGIVYRGELCGTAMHRQMWEEVRVTLGQALLSSPLALDDINAVFLMSNNANTPNNQGSEYIDSWLLTGYCAKQAMLSISFTRIVERINRNAATVEDQQAIRLFAVICVHHLQWAATTGRPSIIPAAYINQCNLLHSFRGATMQDGMLVAEAFLYSDLHQKLSRHSYLGDAGARDEFMPWRQKWEYLWALPTSLLLKVGYHAACLILSLRCLEESGGALRPQTFLSDDDDAERVASGGGSSSDGNGKDNALLAHACKHAKRVLETFLEMSPALMDSVPTCLCLCVGYCALMLAHYDEAQSKIADPVSLDVITRIDSWVRHAPGKAWSYKYGELARRKVHARINNKAKRTNEATETEQQPGCHSSIGGDGNHHERRRSRAGLQEQPQQQQPPTSHHGNGRGEGETSADFGDAVVYNAAAAEWAPPEPSFDPATPGMVFEQSPFPSLEYYFGGGFYDFTR